MTNHREALQLESPPAHGTACWLQSGCILDMNQSLRVCRQVRENTKTRKLEERGTVHQQNVKETTINVLRELMPANRNDLSNVGWAPARGLVLF